MLRRRWLRVKRSVACPLSPFKRPACSPPWLPPQPNPPSPTTWSSKRETCRRSIAIFGVGKRFGRSRRSIWKFTAAKFSACWAQRLGQNHHHQAAAGTAVSHQRPGAGLRPRRHRRRPRTSGSGYLPEESYLYRFLNAEETLDFYGRLFDMPADVRRERTAELIDMVGLNMGQAAAVARIFQGHDPPHRPGPGPDQRSGADPARRADQRAWTRSARAR